ncbi:MAG TPA: DUF3667 domain-containing protein [Pyrinomonadaceae bacterium]|nr:DUF3667 domain-containing protein [Pyrinomonadaceae bacterium]
MKLEPQLTPVSTADAVAADVCPNCNEQLLGQYCHRCGEQRFERTRLSFKHFAVHSVQELIDIEHSKVWSTFYALVFRPGFLTNEYLAGRKSRYLTPLKVCLIVFALSLFLYSIYKPVAVYDLGTMIESDDTGTWDKLINDLAEYKQMPRDVLIGSVNEKWQAYVSWSQLTNVLFFALLLQILYLFSKRYFAEHLIFSLHFLSFTFLSTIILWPAYILVGVKPTTASLLLGFFVAVVGMVYLFFALRIVYKQPTGLTLMKTFFLFVGSYLIILSIMLATLILAFASVLITS